MNIDKKLAEQASARLAAEDRAVRVEAENAELREQIAERDEQLARERREAERVKQERDDLRDELDGIELPPGVASGRRRARRAIVTESGAGR
ncbi:hypothetical protein BH708_06365 [Brachybacterium sp. P6-10-X1]|uniref:hypothetical protein n=1 Tax=Brachybacterium sp. P6-10-X1 TaxID=1903186 RepID=UPI0009717A0B|nr:hypothetical protein [Brachybacterium sp. P6-10-X1]APX32407.1 hypothetical protein BH708_06365 [Brachybacterium sp. P6-10-X1]